MARRRKPLTDDERQFHRCMVALSAEVATKARERQHSRSIALVKIALDREEQKLAIMRHQPEYFRSPVRARIDALREVLKVVEANQPVPGPARTTKEELPCKL